MKKAILIVCVVVVAGLVFSVASAAFAQFSTDFESPTYIGTATGTPLEGQEGWISQFGSGTRSVHTYEGSEVPWSPPSIGPAIYNAPVNLTGGDQFVATSYQGRTWTAAAHPAGLVEVSTDFLNSPEHDFPLYQGALTSRGNWSGSGPGNMAGFYSRTASNYVDPGAPPRAGDWAPGWIAYDVDGVQLVNPDGITWRFDEVEGFDNLPRETWWRLGYVLDLDPASGNYRKIVQLKSQDLRENGPIWIIDNPQAMVDNPLDPGGFIRVDMYILGGASGTDPLDAVGLYNVGNGEFHLWDNLYVGQPYDWTVVPEPATLSLLALGGLAVLRRRRRS